MSVPSFDPGTGGDYDDDSPAMRAERSAICQTFHRLRYAGQEGAKR